MLKKTTAFIVSIIIMMMALTSCGTNKQVSYVGVNAEILEIDYELKGFVVKSLDDNSILGEKCYISCEAPDIYYIYADNNTGKTQDLTYGDFVVGDQITVDVKSVENEFALASRIQLLTQRK